MFNSSSIDSCATQHSFWQSANILLTKPNVVNKRLWGSKVLFKSVCKPLKSNWDSLVNTPKLKTTKIIDKYAVKSLLKDLELELDESDNPTDSLVEIQLIELLPRNYIDNHAFQLVCEIKDKAEIVFYDVTPKDMAQDLCPDFPYTLQSNNNQIVLTAKCDVNSKSYKWLIDTVLPQFVKWSEESEIKRVKQNICSESLTLVSNDKYYQKYNDLKLKYGREMVKIWPECTDPSKFVYEDVAIASYLLLLWEEEQNISNSDTMQTFVDLGCGNGLLVYILTMEGHSGVGVDVRKRQIWDIYPKNIKLEEKTVTPSDVCLFPEVDWIIGNHSDELTPWVPVVAARSSYKCKFFLLPCCAFNFDGTKYQRQNSSKSQYNDYLEYIKQLSEHCGFNTDVDRLKIPSTKRICLIGRNRTYLPEEYNKYCNKIQSIISTDTISMQEQKNDQIWIKDFKPRDAKERVRNCTQIDKTLIKSIVDSITRYLLEGCNIQSEWFPGKTADFQEIIRLIPNDMLKALKSECGGLQTLLKNNHHIFIVHNGKVQLRYPKTIEEVRKKIKDKTSSVQIQQKPCWFYNNHPQGCPLSDVNCSFLHVKI